MSIKVVLFDLDGTLLPMNQEVFLKAYSKELVAKLVGFGYEAEQILTGIWSCTEAMLKNDGSCTNEEAFWKRLLEIYGENIWKDKNCFEEFHSNEFQRVQEVSKSSPYVEEMIRALRKAGTRMVLATNPHFPQIATYSRVRWAGLNPEDFELITTYENSCYSKPNFAYYEEILAKIKVAPEECLMVGNDIGDDMVAQKMGMQVFLLTDFLINKDDVDISVYPHGSYPELAEYLRSLQLM